MWRNDSWNNSFWDNPRIKKHVQLESYSSITLWKLHSQSRRSWSHQNIFYDCAPPTWWNRWWEWSFPMRKIRACFWRQRIQIAHCFWMWCLYSWFRMANWERSVTQMHWLHLSWQGNPRMFWSLSQWRNLHKWCLRMPSLLLRFKLLNWRS